MQQQAKPISELFPVAGEFDRLLRAAFLATNPQPGRAFVPRDSDFVSRIVADNNRFREELHLTMAQVLKLRELAGENLSEVLSPAN